MFREYRRVFRFLKPHMGFFVLAFISMVICSLTGSISTVGLVIPFVDKVIAGKQIVVSENVQSLPFVNDIINRINAADNALALFNQLIIIGIILILIRSIFEYAKSYFMNVLGYRFLKDIRGTVYRKVMGLSMDYFYKNPTGKLASKIMFDTAIIKDSLIEGLTDLFYQPVQLLFYISAMFFIKFCFDIPVGLILISMSLTLLIIYPVVRIGRRIRKISLMMQEKVADINTALFETISGMAIVKAFFMQKYEACKLDKQNQQHYRIMMKSVKRMLAISPITELMQLVCVAIVVWVGGRIVFAQGLSAGAFLGFIGALVSVFKPFKRLSRVYVINQKALAAASRIFEILDTESKVIERPNPVILDTLKNEIVYEDVHFAYEDQPVLAGVTIRVKKGEIAAFVGPSGVGKTSLVNLLPRFYDPQRGSVRIDGTDIKDISLQSLRSQIGIVTQDTILFNDTVAQNIAYGQDVQPHMDAIIKAAKASNSHHFIMNMPQGYDTVIGERGFRLSGGEKQRLCIARAIFKNPPILILDEATSQLDTESELLVQEAIDRLMAGRTVLVIAHRLSTIKHASVIYVLEKGRVVEKGSHEALMVKSGLYNKLYNLQFKLV